MKESVGKKISKLRRFYNLTQVQLAQKTYVSNKTISKWESDVVMPSIEDLKNIAKIFNVSIDDLLNENVTINIVISINKNK